jgi:pimeloyl-ACP methyl ester carboxylesterase
MAVTEHGTTSSIGLRPFTVDFEQSAIEDLRSRIATTRWPSKELVPDRSQGVQLATLQALARYSTTEYDWRRAEAKLNALPQFTTEIDGADIHFIHVRSAHEDALPLIMTHGWPGSVVELIDSVGPLTDPTAHGGSAEDAFHLVLPALPGYGLSAEPVEVGWDLGRTARAWAELMRRLGYDRYVAQGGDVGAGVTDTMSRQTPEGLVGVHTNLLVPALNGPMPTNTAEERAAAAQIATFGRTGNGYFVEMATRPQTIGYALLDSPVALAAWMIDHDTDAYYRIARAFVDAQPSGNLTRDPILDNITLYWLTGTGASAARSYWEGYGADAPAAGQRPCLRRRSPSRSRRSPPRSGRRHGAGSKRATRTSSTSTKPREAATSRPGRSRNCSPPSYAPRSVRFAEKTRRKLRLRRVAPGSHGHAKPDDVRLPATRQTRAT